MRWTEILIIAVIVLIVGGVGFMAADSMAGHRSEAEQVHVVNREYTPPRSWTSVTIVDGKPVTQQHHEAARHRVVVNCNDGVHTYDVSRNEYNLYVVGQTCTRWKQFGRWTGWCYGRTLSPITAPLTPER